MKTAIGPAGSLGLIQDERPYELAPAAWTNLHNMRFKNGAAERVAGYASAYDPPSIPPYCLFYVPASQPFWLYAGLEKVYATDGAQHTDVTRSSGGDYSANADQNWTGGVLNGIAVLNNGVDPPQYWPNSSLATHLAELANWPASTKCGSLRTFKNFLVALDVTESGTRYPQLVRWSHPADPGTVPPSWDYADPSLDAGRVSLSETKDACVDCATLRDVNIIYKEQTTHVMQYIGGTLIFRFPKLFDNIGAISRRCAFEFFSGQHIVRSVDDLVTHDGQSAKSLLTTRMRRALNNDVDPSKYKRTFLAANWPDDEILVCYVPVGGTLCSKALVWNFREDKFSFRDLPDLAHIESGTVDVTPHAPTTWDAFVGKWNSTDRPWDLTNLDPTKRQLLAAAPLATKLYVMPTGTTADSASYSAFLERQALALPDAQGNPDRDSFKQIKAIRPAITGPVGSIIQVYVGGHKDYDTPVSYKGPFEYKLGRDSWIDCTVTDVRFAAVKFMSQESFDWRMSGYELDFVARGAR